MNESIVCTQIKVRLFYKKISNVNASSIKSAWHTKKNILKRDQYGAFCGMA